MALVSPVETTASPTAMPPNGAPSPQALPHLNTSTSGAVPSPSTLPRAVSAKNAQRFSTYSVRSNTSNTQAHMSRPGSTAFPFFHSSLTYALVRDFAYPSFHPLHYGPSPDSASGISTPASSEQRRLSDPAPSWDGSRGAWSAGPWEPSEPLPNSMFGDGGHDGPPWSEDEDLASPVVTSARHKKNRSSTAKLESTTGGRARATSRPEAAPRAMFSSSNGDVTQTFYVGDVNEAPNGPGGEYITYPPAVQPNTQPSSRLGIGEDNRRDSHFAGILPSRSYVDTNFAPSPSPRLPDDDVSDMDDHRFSRDYQFTIASPDEEMHGKAVALFDFARESEVELPLSEGQVILVSYRHGQGWLVAQDPKTGDTGLVPEEYVRLLRDIEGGYHGLMNGNGIDIDSAEAKTPTQESQAQFERFPVPVSNNNTTVSSPSSATGDYYVPVVSTFSTHREDFEPHQKAGGSQGNTPTTGPVRGGEMLSPKKMEVSEPKFKDIKDVKQPKTMEIETEAVKIPK
jgi:hypothetical protein